MPQISSAYYPSVVFMYVWQALWNVILLYICLFGVEYLFMQLYKWKNEILSYVDFATKLGSLDLLISIKEIDTVHNKVVWIDSA